MASSAYRRNNAITFFKQFGFVFTGIDVTVANTATLTGSSALPFQRSPLSNGHD